MFQQELDILVAHPGYFGGHPDLPIGFIQFDVRPPPESLLKAEAAAKNVVEEPVDLAAKTEAEGR